MLQRSCTQKRLVKNYKMTKQKYQKTYISPEERKQIMEYQRIAYLLDIASNQSSKFRTRNWVEKNDESRGECTLNLKLQC